MKHSANGTTANLVQDLTAELAVASSGVTFIAECLDRLVEELEVRGAVAVLHDPVLGPQLFSPGRRPLSLDTSPTALLAKGPGIHTDPAVPDRAGELDAVRHLCEVALRLDRLQYESLHDPLTGLYNRRGFDTQLLQAVSNAQRYRWTFALVVLDLDGFKLVNDRLGHQHGDTVLRGVGERLRLGLRAGDVAARLGGDEFAMIVHVDGGTEVSSVLQRLGAASVLGGGTATDINWTMGVSLCPDEARSAEDLHHLADIRLYEAKSAKSVDDR
jgi:diguanylate cyclase (GGDEF)-like protein